MWFPQPKIVGMPIFFRKMTFLQTDLSPGILHRDEVDFLLMSVLGRGMELLE